MVKSNHIYRTFDIPYDELGNFINPININIDIPYFDMLQISNDKEKMSKKLSGYYDSILKNMPIIKSTTSKRKLTYITYTAHLDGYDFRVNPITFINNVLKENNLNYSIPRINLDDEQGKEYLKDYLRSYVNDVKRVEPSKLGIVDELQKNIDYLLDVYDISLDPYLSSLIIPKDALFYLVYSSLVKYEETNDKKYKIIPYEYFKYVSHMTTSYYPHSLNIPSKFGKKWYTDFNAEYKVQLGEDYYIDDTPYLLQESEVYLAWDILQPGMVDREIRNIVERARANPNVDYEKYQRLFEKKMNYYTNSGYNRNIIGKYGLLGYVGFTYPNEYLVFDKFHNSDTIDPAKRTILTHGEAIYALPSDRFEVVGCDKQTVQEEKKIDPRIKKINHNETFIRRLDPVVHGPNVSTSTFDEESEKMKQKILIRHV